MPLLQIWIFLADMRKDSIFILIPQLQLHNCNMVIFFHILIVSLVLVLFAYGFYYDVRSGQVRSSRYRNLLLLVQGFSRAMHGAVQELAVERQRVLGQTHIVDQQEMADGSLVLQLLRKEQSQDRAHISGVPGGYNVVGGGAGFCFLATRVDLRGGVEPMVRVILFICMYVSGYWFD